MQRPSTLGRDVTVKSLDDADAVLHELAWIANQTAALNAAAKQKIDAIKLATAEKAVVTIEEETMTLEDRAAQLEKLLSKWVSSNIEKHLTGKKRSIELAHGKLGLRQQPLVAALAEESSDKTVLDAIDETTGLITAIMATLQRKTTIGTARAGDLITVEIKPAFKAMRDAYESKLVTAEALQSIGVALRDAYDEPVLTPTKTLVLSE